MMLIFSILLEFLFHKYYVEVKIHTGLNNKCCSFELMGNDFELKLLFLPVTSHSSTTSLCYALH